MANTITFEGCNFFRQRLILSTLSGKTVKIKNIRVNDDNPGLQGFEANFIRLLDTITNGSRIVVNETGTSLLYQPGLLMGGEISHDCNLERGIGYYLEALLCLAPFTKTMLHGTLKGITHDQTDPSVDLIKLSTIPVLRKFLGGYDDSLELKIMKRGVAPGGGGRVTFSCPCKKKLMPIMYLNPGKVKRIRGIAWTVKTSPAVANRVVDSARSILNKFLPDIYIYTDSHRGVKKGKSQSPGFGVTLVAETKEKTFYCAECVSNPKGSEKGPTVPEDLGKQAAMLLLEEIYRGGCVDSNNQSLAALFMVLGQQDVSKVQIGPISPYCIQFLRHIRDFLDVMFKVEPEAPSDDKEDLNLGAEKLILTCVGVGFTNLSKAIS